MFEWLAPLLHSVRRRIQVWFNPRVPAAPRQYPSHYLRSNLHGRHR